MNVGVPFLQWHHYATEEPTRLPSYLLIYRSRLVVCCRPLSHKRSLKEWLGYEIINGWELRSGQPPNLPHCLIACSIPNFVFRLLHLSPGLCPGAVCQLFTPRTTPKCVRTYHPHFYAQKHWSGGRHNILNNTTTEIKKHMQKYICILGQYWTHRTAVVWMSSVYSRASEPWAGQTQVDAYSSDSWSSFI